jgi:hypothetical protein
MQGQIELLDYLKNIGHEDSKNKIPQEKQEYQVIRIKDMKVIRERNFVEICTDSRICISATVKLLDNNMVYWSEWFKYPFLDIGKSEKEAEKQYKEHLKNISDRLHQPPRFEVKVPVELEDMYLCVNGIWSCDTYTFRNGAVKI